MHGVGYKAQTDSTVNNNLYCAQVDAYGGIGEGERAEVCLVLLDDGWGDGGEEYIAVHELGEATADIPDHACIGLAVG